MLVIDSNMAKLPRNCHECFMGFGGFCAVAPDETDGICPDSNKPEWCPVSEEVEAVPIDFIAGKMADTLGCPCNVSPLDEQMSVYCGQDCHMHDIDCWQRVIRMWSGLPLEEQNGGNDGTEEQIK